MGQDHERRAANLLAVKKTGRKQNEVRNKVELLHKGQKTHKLWRGWKWRRIRWVGRPHHEGRTRNSQAVAGVVMKESEVNEEATSRGMGQKLTRW